MGLSRQEVNLRRLLAKCELMCKNRKEDDKIEKYVDTLEDMFHEVRKIGDSSENVACYLRRIKAIKASLGITKDKYQEEDDPETVRNNLLGVRHRNVTKAAGDLDEIINYNETVQAKITGDMLMLTKTLKEQSEAANKIIRKDTEIVSRSAQLTEQNLSKLSVESSKLAEHSKRAWKCWMWILLAIVFIVFISKCNILL
ncbi:unnamed protein product [Acanthoscelides obtectus]|uniref:Vesicle transport protein USE1 n=1 Tax=Acanthoscelides obtectus TaxID=200917 RepID=A0A9P0K3L2_ACAOB|nr:unnamed protein product [Acanthoscelides obtectus]CAK1657027.1 Vesicle transport protein USE1 [Acanthoscelides obtectus]